MRVGEQLRHIIAETLTRGHFHDQALLDASHVTVTEVRISPDLKNATAYVMSLGGLNMDSILPALNNAASLFQKEVGRQNSMKFTPKIRFKIDDSFEQAQKIEDLLRDLHIPEE